jgi:hypothetical protein
MHMAKQALKSISSKIFWCAVAFFLATAPLVFKFCYWDFVKENRNESSQKFSRLITYSWVASSISGMLVAFAIYACSVFLSGCSFTNNDHSEKKYLDAKKVFMLAKNREEQFYTMTPLMMESVNTKRIEEAKKLVVEMEMLINDFHDNWHYGNAAHVLNIVKGRIALIEGDIKSSRQYLLAAGKCAGSPQLNSYGPNTTLAKELLECGEKQVVIEFLRLSEIFWKENQNQIEHWIQQINSGENPDFGKNMVLVF